MSDRTPAMQQNWQSPEKSQHFKEKKQFLNEQPVCAIFIYLTLIYAQYLNRRSPSSFYFFFFSFFLNKKQLYQLAYQPIIRLIKLKRNTLLILFSMNSVEINPRGKSQAHQEVSGHQKRLGRFPIISWISIGFIVILSMAAKTLSNFQFNKCFDVWSVTSLAFLDNNRPTSQPTDWLEV